MSISHVSRVQASRYRRIIGAFKNRPAVREERHFVRLVEKFENELIMADLAMRLQAFTDRGKIHGAVTLVDLHRVPYAKGYVWLVLPGKMRKLAQLANATPGARPRSGNFGPFIRPDVAGKKSLPQLLRGTHQQLDGFRGRKRNSQVDGHVQNPRRLARLHGSPRRFRENASQTGSLSGNDVQGRGIAAHSSAVDPGHAVLYRPVIQQKSGFEIVGPIQNQRRAR